MVNKGWRHEDLMEMSVEEAAFWIGQQAAYDKAVAEAVERATRR